MQDSGQQQAADGADGIAAGLNGSAGGTIGQDAAAAGGGVSSSSGKPQHLQSRLLVGGGPAAAAARKRAAAGSHSKGGTSSEQQPSVAEVLGNLGRDDCVSDVNGVLGALLHLFGRIFWPPCRWHS